MPTTIGRDRDADVVTAEVQTARRHSSSDGIDAPFLLPSRPTAATEEGAPRWESLLCRRGRDPIPLSAHPTTATEEVPFWRKVSTITLCLYLT